VERSSLQNGVRLLKAAIELLRGKRLLGIDPARRYYNCVNLLHFWHNTYMRRETAGWIFPAVIFMCLSACAAAQPAPTTTAIPSQTSSPPSTSTYTITASHTSTTTVTETPVPTATLTLTLTHTPSRTKNAYKYVFPVQPQSAADFASGGHAYPATDIYAPAGTDFVAVTAGTVDFVSLDDKWNPESDDPAVAGGLCVAIIGDDGIRYYGSHLSAVADGIKRGVRVHAGQLLGLVGKSGNAANTTPHLHFGISHPTYPEDWLTRRGELDPYPYLVAWSRGEDVTPRFPTPTATD
jgi:murein DD-endopeptidase MepM/ murein hydrolase activator NlpD